MPYVVFAALCYRRKGLGRYTKNLALQEICRRACYDFSV